MIKLWKPLTGAAIATAAALTVASAASAAPVAAAAPRMSAVTLANGIIFDQGPAAHYLSSFSRTSTTHGMPVAGLEKAVDRSITSQPRLAVKLSSELQSGNRIEVNEALNSLAQVLYASMNKLYGPGETQQILSQVQSAITNTVSKGSGDAPDAFKTTFNAVYKVAQLVVIGQGVAVEETVAANLIFVLTAAVLFFSPNQPATSDQLRQQEFVNTVATKLRAA